MVVQKVSERCLVVLSFWVFDLHSVILPDFITFGELQLNNLMLLSDETCHYIIWIVYQWRNYNPTLRV